MANVEIFKTSFKGYNKEEVIAYIENLNTQLAMLQKELNEAKSALEIYEQERSEAAETQGQNQVDEGAIREELLTELKPVLTEEIRANLEGELRPVMEQELRRTIEGELVAKYEDAIRAELNNRLQNQAQEMEDLRRRAQLYDDNREVLAELMIKAKNDAAGIIQDAEEHARQLREEAEQKFRLLIADYELLKNNLLTAKEEVVVKMRNAIKIMDEFNGEFACMDQDVAHSVSHLEEQ